MSAVRDIASLRFSKPLSVSQRRRRSGARRQLATRPQTLAVHPSVLAAAHAARRIGERIVIVDERTIRLVPS